MLYQLQICPIFVTILNEVKPNESNLRVRSLVIFNEGWKKENELNPFGKYTSLFSELKTWRWYSALSSGSVWSEDEHHGRHVVFDVYDVTVPVQQSPSGARLTSLTFRL